MSTRIIKLFEYEILSDQISVETASYVHGYTIGPTLWRSHPTYMHILVAHNCEDCILRTCMCCWPNTVETASYVHACAVGPTLETASYTCMYVLSAQQDKTIAS